MTGTGETENSRTMQSHLSLASLAGGLMTGKGGGGWGSEEVALLVQVEMMDYVQQAGRHGLVITEQTRWCPATAG